MATLGKHTIGIIGTGTMGQGPAQVAARVRSAFGVELPVSALFDAPTVGGLAGLLGAAPAQAVGPALVAVGRDEEADPKAPRGLLQSGAEQPGQAAGGRKK